MGIHSYFNMMKHTVLLLLSINVVLSLNQSQATKVAPCTVQNVMIQPQFGMSAKTKQPVDILQAPPLLTQTIYAGICIENTFSQQPLLPNIPNFTCRQRYSLVEVYSKPQQDYHAIKSLQTILKVPNEKMSNEYVKNFILVEDGCDILVNFPPLNSYVLKGDQDLMKLALSQFTDNVVTTTQDDKIEGNQLDFDSESEDSHNSNHKNRNLKPRMVKVEVDYFRRGLHLQRPGTTTDSTTTDHEPPTSTHDADTLTPNRNRSIGIPYESTKDESDVYGISDNEIPLSPEDIGLPVLILDPSLDPIMILISKYSEIVPPYSE